jgi:hypothetical protein
VYCANSKYLHDFCYTEALSSPFNTYGQGQPVLSITFLAFSSLKDKCMHTNMIHPLKHKKKPPWLLVGKETIPSDRRLSAKLVPTFADRGCRVVSATDPHGG